MSSAPGREGGFTQAEAHSAKCTHGKTPREDSDRARTLPCARLSGPGEWTALLALCVEKGLGLTGPAGAITLREEKPFPEESGLAVELHQQTSFAGQG